MDVCDFGGTFCEQDDCFDGDEEVKRLRNCEKNDDDVDFLLLRRMTRIGDVHMHPKTSCSTRRLVRDSICPLPSSETEFFRIFVSAEKWYISCAECNCKRLYKKNSRVASSITFLN